jgi:mRNA-degrading endonuclease RelE of RelBE toxin-antitoxin system
MSPNDESPPTYDVFFTGEFKRNLRQLAKKYRRIKTDIQPLLTDLEAGKTPGDQIPGLDVVIYKVRVRNSDSAKGKSGGYRIIYQKTTDLTVILITVYSKTEQTDISPEEVRAIITTYEHAHIPEEDDTNNPTG